jgi:eukaryotic-like serine/threonine-protein kinase
MSVLTCLRCQSSVAESLEECPSCGEKITGFQRTYSSKLIDGKYQILQRLGLGGMGEIFKVRHIHLNEERVIKIMRANIASDDQALQRFLAEARLATTVKHRNLAMLYDFSTLDDGSYYMVWEYIEGTNIQRWIHDNGPMPPRLAMEIAIQALYGLEVLHQQGIIHRDISPENIMLSQDFQGKLLVKVIDFGIAKQLSDAESGQGLTQTGMFLGKLKYASPEQAGFIREGEQLDARSDLYSFGIVVYEMLAGRAPFNATNPQGYILKHATEKPQPIAQFNPSVSVPARLEEVVLKSLEKDRDKRQATASEFVGELEGLRGEIAPDAKFGTGEKLTVSSKKTVLDAQGTKSGRTVDASLPKTQPGRAAAPKGPATRSDDATIVESLVSGSAKTLTDRPAGTSADATMIEKLGGSAAPTVLEKQIGYDPHAEATVLEQKFVAQKKKTPIYAGIAAAIVAVAAGGFFMFNKQAPEIAANPAAVQTSTTSSASALVPASTEETVEASSLPTVPGQGFLLLSASPWGSIEEIVAADGKKIDIAADQRTLPNRLTLPEGEYNVTVSDADGRRRTIKTTVAAGQTKTERAAQSKIDIEKAIDEVMGGQR